jgi:predicted P-loop ATPase
MKASFYQNINHTSNGETLDITEILERIKSGEFQDITLKIANEKDKKQRNELKKLAPYFTPSGVFGKRQASGLIQHSGLIAMDFDNLENIAPLEIALKNDPYSFAVFRSISHRGLCVLVKIDPTRHLDSFKALELYYWTLLNATVDQSGKDVSRARYVSFDADLYINNRSKKYTDFSKLEAMQGAKKNSVALIPETDYDKIINNILKWWDSRYGYHDGQRNQNLFILAQAFNEYGIDKDYCLGYLQNNIISDDFSSKELEQCVNSAYRRTTANTKKFEDKKTVEKVKKAIKSGSPIEQVAVELGIPQEELEKRIEADENKPKAPKGLDIKAVQLYIQKLGIKRNLVTRMYEDKYGNELEQNQLNTIFVETKIKFDKLSRELFDTILYSTLTPDYNPLLDYLKLLNWDGRDRLTALAESVTSNTGNPDFRQRMITKWLFGAIKCAFDGEPNVLNLIFAGEKNTGKTEFFKRLLPEQVKRYFASSQLDNGKDDLILMTQKWFIFDDEYSGKSKQDSKRMKMLLSSSDFSLREPYGRKNVTLKRLATLCGTCNELEILNDPTGNRRIVVIEATGQFDFNLYNGIDKTQLFAQLVDMYRNGYNNHLTKAEISELETYTAKQYSEVSIEEELILQFYSVPLSPSSAVWKTASMIKVEIEKETNQRLNLRRLGMTLRTLGFQRLSKKGTYGYLVSLASSVAKADGDQINMGLDNGEFTVLDANDPFELP